MSKKKKKTKVTYVDRRLIINQPKFSPKLSGSGLKKYFDNGGSGDNDKGFGVRDNLETWSQFREYKYSIRETYP